MSYLGAMQVIGGQVVVGPVVGQAGPAGQAQAGYPSYREIAIDLQKVMEKDLLPLVIRKAQRDGRWVIDALKNHPEFFGYPKVEDTSYNISLNIFWMTIQEIIDLYGINPNSNSQEITSVSVNIFNELANSFSFLGTGFDDLILSITSFLDDAKSKINFQVEPPTTDQPSAGYGLPSGGIVGGAYADLPGGDAGFTQPGLPPPEGDDGYWPSAASPASKIGTYLMIAGAAILVLFLTKK